MAKAHNMWRGDVGILINLERVMWRNATFCCEWKFSYDVGDLRLNERGMPGLLAFRASLFDLILVSLFRWLRWGSLLTWINSSFSFRFGLVVIVINNFCLLWCLRFINFGLEFLTSRHGPFRVLCLLLDTLQPLGDDLLFSSLRSICWIKRFCYMLRSSLCFWLQSLITFTELAIRVKWFTWTHWPV